MARPASFHPQCEYLASRGMVAISAEYRVKNLHGTTPQECVKDGKSAIRYVRQNAASLGIDPNRIAAGGGSAGGHVAAATAMLTAYEEPTENLAISSKPNALVLYNAVVDNGPGGYGYSTVQAYWQTISPLYNLQNTTVVPPPTVFFLGTSDAYIPVATGQAIRRRRRPMGRAATSTSTRGSRTASSTTTCRTTPAVRSTATGTRSSKPTNSSSRSVT